MESKPLKRLSRRCNFGILSILLEWIDSFISGDCEHLVCSSLPPINLSTEYNNLSLEFSTKKDTIRS